MGDEERKPMTAIQKLVIASNFVAEAREKDWHAAIVHGNAANIAAARDALNAAIEAKLDSQEVQVRAMLEGRL